MGVLGILGELGPLPFCSYRPETRGGDGDDDDGVTFYWSFSGLVCTRAAD